METLWQGLRQSARSLFKHPTFTIVAVIALSLGIGLNLCFLSLLSALSAVSSGGRGAATSNQPELMLRERPGIQAVKSAYKDAAQNNILASASNVEILQLTSKVFNNTRSIRVLPPPGYHDPVNIANNWRVNVQAQTSKTNRLRHDVTNTHSGSAPEFSSTGISRAKHQRGQTE